MIDVRDLRFTYPGGGFWLRVPKWTVARGETVALIGPSGLGKTTLLSLLAGILAPRTGRVRVDGVEVSVLADRARREFRIRHAGLVFQEFELLEYLNVLDNILLPCRIASALKLDGASRDRAAELAGRMGMADKLRRFPRQLSQGERQRVALCRALLPQPPLLLADEPTGNLDPATRDRVLEVVFDYVHRQNATLVAVTHEHELLDRFDRTVDAARLFAGTDKPAATTLAPGGSA